MKNKIAIIGLCIVTLLLLSGCGEKKKDAIQTIRGLKKEQNTAVTQLSAIQIQTALKNAGFYKGSIDGKMGSKTQEAIVSFQKANGLTSDGIVGRKTILKLRNYLDS